MPKVQTGTNADDVLSGTTLDDIILGRGGNDSLDGGAGNDTVFGGSGLDTLIGGLGNNSLSGEDGDDRLFGGAGDDTMLGQAGSDLLVWNDGDGSDTVSGGSEVDTAVVNGASAAGDVFHVAAGGMDVLFQQAGSAGSTLNLYQIEALEVYGQGGDDLLVAGALTNTSLRQIYFEGGLGNDTLDGTASTIALVADGGDGADSLVGGTGADTLRGAGGADVLVGGRGGDLLDGGSGDDRFIWTFGDGADRVIGGADNDTLQIIGTTADDSLTLRVDGNQVVLESSGVPSDALDIREVEAIEVTGGDGDDLLSVGLLSSTAVSKIVFDGGRGADILDGSDARVPLKPAVAPTVMR